MPLHYERILHSVEEKFCINSLKLRSGVEGVYRNTSEFQACHFFFPGGGAIRISFVFLWLCCDLTHQMKCFSNHLDVCPSGKEPKVNFWKGGSFFSKNHLEGDRTSCLSQSNRPISDLYTSCIAS